MADKITWTTEQRKLGEIVPWARNPRQLSIHDAEHIRQSIKKFGLADPLIINIDNTMIGGHQRQNVMGDPDLIVDVRVPSRQLTDREVEELNIRLNRNIGNWDFDILANEFEVDDLKDWGFANYELGIDLEALPNIDGWEEPETAYRIIIACENGDQVKMVCAELGIPYVEGRVRYDFDVTRLSDGK